MLLDPQGHSGLPALSGPGPHPLSSPPFRGRTLASPFSPALLCLAFDLCLSPHTQIHSCLLFVSPSFSTCLPGSLSQRQLLCLARRHPSSQQSRPRVPAVPAGAPASPSPEPSACPPALWAVQGGAGIRGGSRGSGCRRGPLPVSPALPPALSPPAPSFFPPPGSFPGSPAPPPSLPAARSRCRRCPGEGETRVGSREAREEAETLVGQELGFEGEEGKGGGDRSGEREERPGLGP